MALTAADLQRRHELEGAPDPFPSNPDAAPARPRANPAPAAKALDTDSEVAFPSLAPAPAAATAPKSAWGSANGPRIKPVAKAPVFTDSFQLSNIDTSSAGKDGKPTTLGEVIKHVMTKFPKVKVDASANQRLHQTTFHMKAESQKDLDKAKRALLSALSPVVTIIVQAPASTIATIIGPKGATLKQIRDQTNVKIDIPRKETVNGNANGNAAHGQDDEEDEVLIPISVNGPQPMVEEAGELLKQIIASKTSRTTQRVKDIPAHILPFIKARRAHFATVAESDDVKLTLNSADRELSASGDRQAVTRVIEAVKQEVETLQSNLQTVKIALPKRQHRLLAGQAVQDIMNTSKCSIVVSSPDEPGDEVAVWGQPSDLPAGLAAVMTQANSKYIREFPLPGPIAVSRQLVNYIVRIGYPKKLMAENTGVSVYTPSTNAVASASSLAIDLVGEKAEVDAVVRQLSELLGKLIGATTEVNIDWLLHRTLIGKQAKKIKQFHEAHNVSVYFPGEEAEQSSVLLVYDPFTPSASPSPDDKKQHLDDVSKELLKLSKEAGEVKTEHISVEKRWHDAILGQNGTTLNAIIGEEKALSIKVGADAQDPAGEDAVVVRGASADVDRAVKEILKIVENAKNDVIVNSHVLDFDIDREYVGRIVGSQGSGINKLRDALGVKLDVSDEFDDKDTKKKKGTHQKAKITITGRKENAEEAKRRILAQVDRLADETSEVLKIPNQYHPSLIGTSGKYAIRLEEKYGVKITFPRAGGGNNESNDKTREALKSDEVLVKGGKKGVAQAKSELMEAYEYEKDNNQSIKFTVPTKSVARILGRGGASINDIKNSTDTQIDVDRAEESATTSVITVRGTKKNIAAAKTQILAISDSAAEEVTVNLTIENKFHRSLIGGGGQGLKDLVERCGGPSDSRILAQLIRFPRQNEPSDEVRLRGDAKLVEKIKQELEKAVALLRDRVILGVDVPAAQHRAIIGRGGANLNELQTKFGVQIQFPGSRSYSQFGAPTNADEIADSDPANIIKVSGPSESAQKAVDELKNNVKAPAAEAVTATMEVPVKYHHTISQNGQFFRTLRSWGVHVDHSVVPKAPAAPVRPTSSETPSTRIDDVEDEPAVEAVWEVVSKYEEADEGNSTWTIRGRDQAAVDKAQKAITDAIAVAEKATSVGFLTLPDRSQFPRIVGTKGANVSRLRNETGADILVSRDSNTIVITGSTSSLELAKESILKMLSTSSYRGGKRA